MLNCIIILLAFFGAHFALSETELFAPVRRFLFNLEVIGPWFIKMFTCPACLGWWIGTLIYSLFYLGHNESFAFSTMFIWGFASSGLNLLIHMMLEKLRGVP
jgi:hypothetical protein